MQRIHLVAWSAAEAQDRGHLLKRAGFSVETTRLSPQVLRGIKRLPDAFVFDLSRAPSLGRDMALFIRQLAMTRRVPLVFVGGDPAKVAGIREVLPDASYITDWSGAVLAVKRAIANPPETPLVPGVFAPFAKVPLAQKLGIDPVHFGMIVIVNLLIGTNTPPFGIALFITMQIARVSFAAITRAVLPFLIPMIATLLLITFFPGLVLFLPNLFK